MAKWKEPSRQWKRFLRRAQTNIWHLWAIEMYHFTMPILQHNWAWVTNCKPGSPVTLRSIVIETATGDVRRNRRMTRNVLSNSTTPHALILLPRSTPGCTTHRPTRRRTTHRDRTTANQRQRRPTDLEKVSKGPSPSTKLCGRMLEFKHSELTLEQHRYVTCSIVKVTFQ